FRLAAVGAADAIIIPDKTDHVYAGRAGAVGQFCFELLCRSSLSVNGGAIFGSDTKNLPLYFSRGVTLRASSLVSLLVEPALVTSGERSSSRSSLGVFSYGLRLSGKQWGVDITFVRPLQDDTTLVMGVPWLSFTYRTDSAVDRARAEIHAPPL